MTQDQLSAKTGIPQSMISVYLSAGKVFDVELLDRVCRVLGLDLVNVITVARDAEQG